MEDDFTHLLKQEAHQQGFQLAGVCAAVEPAGAARLAEWLEAGYAGEMHYIVERQSAYAHPRSVLDGVRSLLMLGMNYGADAAAEPAAGEARIARYAWGTRDYHDLIHERLQNLCRFVKDHQPQALVRGVVDTAPLLEREFAELAGLGWVGKHTLLLNRQAGSWFFLAAVLTDCDLTPDEPHQTDHCGTCRACLDACPTGAFPAERVLDATRCISYLTIEHRGPIPRELRPGIGDWLFGCDVCQDVCPWNRRAPEADEADFFPQEEFNPLDAAALFDLDEAAFRQRFRRTPLWRSKRRGLLRNAAIVLGNRPSERGLSALLNGIHETDPIVRGACVWALHQYSSPTAQEALRTLRAAERDPLVLAEFLDDAPHD